jgi:hypothetical protein
MSKIRQSKTMHLQCPWEVIQYIGKVAYAFGLLLQNSSSRHHCAGGGDRYGEVMDYLLQYHVRPSPFSSILLAIEKTKSKLKPVDVAKSTSPEVLYQTFARDWVRNPPGTTSLTFERFLIHPVQVPRSSRCSGLLLRLARLGTVQVPAMR